MKREIMSLRVKANLLTRIYMNASTKNDRTFDEIVSCTTDLADSFNVTSRRFKDRILREAMEWLVVYGFFERKYEGKKYRYQRIERHLGDIVKTLQDTTRRRVFDRVTGMGMKYETC